MCGFSEAGAHVTELGAVATGSDTQQNHLFHKTPTCVFATSRQHPVAIALGSVTAEPRFAYEIYLEDQTTIETISGFQPF